MKRVLYVPLDDRPVNLDDVILQGKSAGIEVITPNNNDIKNRLDTKKTISGSTLLGTMSPRFGTTSNIRQFILNNASSADGFIISTDMLAYGGLIGSRRLRTSDGGIYPNFDTATTNLLDVIREIKQCYPSKPVYVMDTIMRLATSAYVEGQNYDAYTESRNFSLQPRQIFEDFNDIITGYNTKPDNTPYGDTVHFDKEQYYNARHHKFNSNYYILDQLARLGYIDFLAIGVDDSSTQGVQANEIGFIERYINEQLGGGTEGQNPERAIILPDADGLGHSLLARMANHLYCEGVKPRYRVQYYGPHGSTIINTYEYMTVHDNISRHVDMIGGQFVTSGSYDLEIVAITDVNQVSSAISRIQSNRNEHIPTIVIDFVAKGASNATVTEALLDCPFTGGLLGYSGWNTAGNKIGIALGMGQARYAYLVTETHPAALHKAVNAHGSLLFKRFLKDYYYKTVVIAEIRTYSRANTLYSNVLYPDQNMGLFNSTIDYNHMIILLQDRMQTYTNTLAGKNAFLIGSTASTGNIRQINSSTMSFSKYSSATLAYANPNYIWERVFEITLSPRVTME
ncbi:DUF4127 family protein [Paenibacillus antarcticus]|uniref:DUF4127 domain-containing protein n=1 Tax=Paenibacillus antarcticus TaxID=253703 RepID=A0A168LVX9_9BACL|nr:DUF4127 family protein [Paenibacillus antarcticus]OAB43910.1 hypothetical protein PBAT_16945 [Paenibacillus antarcticus]